MVTADRAPRRLGDAAASVVLLDRESVASTPAVDLTEVIGRAGGAHLRIFAQPGLVPMASARGFFGGGEAEYVQLRIDGVPVADVETGLADWTGVRARGIERIEVMAGPGSSLYGDTALGGVVQVFTRSAAAPAGGEVALSAGPFDSTAAEAAGRLVRGPWRWSLDGVVADDRGQRDHASRRERGITGLMGRTTAGGNLRFVASAQAVDRLDPGVLPLDAPDRSASDDLFESDFEDVVRRRASLVWQHAGDRSRLSASIHHGRRDSEAVRTLLLAPGMGDPARRTLAATNWGFSGDAERHFFVRGRAAVLRAGIDAGRDRLTDQYSAVDDDGDPTSPSTASDATRRRAALFVTQEWMARDRLRVGIGVRGDAIDDGTPSASREHRAWSPHLSAGVRLGADSIGFLRLSRAFKAPTLDQLFDLRPFPDFAGGTFVISNPALSPQRAAAIEAGFRHHRRRLTAALTLYAMKVREEIDFDPATFRYQNIGRSRHHGVELSVDALPTAAVSPRFSYTFTGVRSASAPGQLKNIPRHRAQLAGRARLPLKVTGDLAVTWTSRRYLDDANTVSVGSDIEVGCRLRRSFGPLDLRLDLLNLTNAVTWGPGYLLQGLDGTLVPYALPAAPRGVRIGLSYEF